MQNFMYIASHFCKILNKILTLKTVYSKKGYYKILPTCILGELIFSSRMKERTNRRAGRQSDTIWQIVAFSNQTEAPNNIIKIYGDIN